MVRIFTTSFLFNHRQYDAIVTMVTKSSRVNITVKVIDPELQELLQGGVFTYESSEEGPSFKNGNALTETLMKSISGAVQQHMVS